LIRPTRRLSRRLPNATPTDVEKPDARGPAAGQSRLKRFLDVALSALLLIVVTPFAAVMAVLIRVDSPGPVIFKATRVGKDSRHFTMYKFRTMGVDAEARLPALAHLNLGGQRLIRIPDDPRVTRLGRLLRRTDLDELPQLVNVLKGDMSLVGPRPQAPNEVALYTMLERQRLRVRPGLTGLWQVTARANPSFDEWTRWDLQYVSSWNIWLDLSIIARTAWMVASGLFGKPSPETKP
jgi:lipopolysaccharide/colanic/teichoic acid biosynthesis glycosyltransferase